MRIGGLASGIDTESIINDLMKANRIPLNKITQKKQYAEWQVANYRSTNLELSKMKDSLFKNQILSSNFNAKNVEVSNPNAVAVKNKNSTGDFSGTLTVEHLAKNATLHGKEVGTLKNANSNATLESLGLVAENGETTISIKAIGSDGKFAVDKDGVDLPPVELKFKSTDTLQSVLNRINKDTGVSAIFDSNTGKIGLAAKNAGKFDGAREIQLSGDLATKLGLKGTGGDPAIKYTKGENAEFTFNGMSMTRSSNTFDINGFEFTLKEVTTSAVSFSSSADTEKIVDNVKQFVDDYNKLIETLNGKIKEPKYRDFHPLSTEEKADMKENEIKLWEEKAMSGTLKNDPIISSLLTEMRTGLMGGVGDKTANQTLASIGITTSKDYLENGKLVLDEDKLKAAISENPEKVHQIFAAGSDKGPIEEQGFARRLRGAITTAESKIKLQAGTMASTNASFSLGKNMINMDKQIERFENKLQMTESRLWKQFNAMENAIQRANAQSASLMSALGGGM